MNTFGNFVAKNERPRNEERFLYLHSFVDAVHHRQPYHAEQSGSLD